MPAIQDCHSAKDCIVVLYQIDDDSGSSLFCCAVRTTCDGSECANQRAVAKRYTVGPPGDQIEKGAYTPQPNKSVRPTQGDNAPDSGATYREHGAAKATTLRPQDDSIASEHVRAWVRGDEQ